MPVAEIHLQRERVFPGAEMAGAYRAPAYIKELVVQPREARARRLS
jgi:hypothetical protein